MVAGEIAPAAVVGGEAVVRGAEVDGGDDYRRASAEAKEYVVDATELEAGATDLSPPEKLAAHRRRVPPQLPHPLQPLLRFRAVAARSSGGLGVACGVCCGGDGPLVRVEAGCC